MASLAVVKLWLNDLIHAMKNIISGVLSVY